MKAAKRQGNKTPLGKKAGTELVDSIFGKDQANFISSVIACKPSAALAIFRHYRIKVGIRNLTEVLSPIRQNASRRVSLDC